MQIGIVTWNVIAIWTSTSFLSLTAEIFELSIGLAISALLEELPRWQLTRMKSGLSPSTQIVNAS